MGGVNRKFRAGSLPRDGWRGKYKGLWSGLDVRLVSFRCYNVEAGDTRIPGLSLDSGRGLKPIVAQQVVSL